MSRTITSLISKPTPVYIPTRRFLGFPGRRRKSSAKQQTTSILPDPIMHQRDLDFIATLWVVDEEAKTDSSDESEQEDDKSDSNTSDIVAETPKACLQRWHTASEYPASSY